ncbi:MAG: hypothetical protein ACQGVK_15385 [Myxococcota bacterium]
MTPSPLRAASALTLESLGDAVRRRVAFVILALGILSLFFVDSCTSCSPTLESNGRSVEAAELAGVTGMILIVSLGLWIQVLAGVLAADHLAEPVSDGSAHLVLARPVSRAVFALTRLAGALLLALGAGALLMSASGGLLAARQGLPPAPLLAAFGACAAGAVAVSAASMALSLWLPRTATALLVFGAVWGIAWLEILGRFGAELSGGLAAIRDFGPPLAIGMVWSLSGWVEGLPEPPGAEPVAWALRAAVWAALTLTGLVVGFRRLELR